MPLKSLAKFSSVLGGGGGGGGGGVLHIFVPNLTMI